MRDFNSIILAIVIIRLDKVVIDLGRVQESLDSLDRRPHLNES